MFKIPLKITDQFKKNYNKIKKILEMYLAEDKNEADTVRVVISILVDMLGYDRYSEITEEQRTSRGYCDLAIKLNDKIKLLIEVKAIGVDLKEAHLRQAVQYGAEEEINWIILTNGKDWQVYKLPGKKSIDRELVMNFCFLDISLKKEEDQEKLFILSKSGIEKGLLKEFNDYSQVVNKYYIGTIIRSDSFVKSIAREFKKFSIKNKIADSKIKKILENEVVKRDIIESNKGQEAISKYNKILKKKLLSI